jgi:hypothetical protein
MFIIKIVIIKKTNSYHALLKIVKFFFDICETDHTYIVLSLASHKNVSNFNTNWVV